MSDYGVRERRAGMLHLPHIKPLTKFAMQLEDEGMGRVKVPKFDPLDAGIDARVLFLFEKPGPRTVGQNGSGFISRNNDDCWQNI
jgi:hypothetical protein